MKVKAPTRRRLWTKRDLDSSVSVILNRPRPEVSLVTDAFIRELMGAVIEHGDCYIEGFGYFHLTVSKGVRATVTRLKRGNFKSGESTGSHLVAVDKKFWVRFRKGKEFKKQIHDRYGGGVVISKEEAPEEASPKWKQKV